MADLWYYTSEGKQMEPVSGAELKQLAASGLLKPTDMVWTDGMDKWVRASSTRDLFSAEGRISTPLTPAAERRPEAPAGRTDPREDRPRRARRESFRDDRDDDDDDRPRRRRRPVESPGMSTGLKVGLILGGSLLGLILIVVVIVAAVKANQRNREAVARMQNQPPVVFNPPVFNPPMKDKGPPAFNPPVFVPQVNGPPARVNSGPHTIGPAGMTFNDQLTLNDSRDSKMGSPCKVFAVNMVAGKTYTIRHNRVDNFNKNRNMQFFDPYLRVENSNFQHLAEDDDGGGNLNSLLFFRPPQTGVYRVIATSLGGGTGQFTLQITVN